MKRLLFICLLTCLLPFTAAHAGVVAEIDFTTTTDGGTGEALDMGTNINASVLIRQAEPPLMRRPTLLMEILASRSHFRLIKK